MKVILRKVMKFEAVQWFPGSKHPMIQPLGLSSGVLHGEDPEGEGVQVEPRDWIVYCETSGQVGVYPPAAFRREFKVTNAPKNHSRRKAQA